LQKISKHLNLRDYNLGNYIFKEGDTPDGVYLIVDGEAQVSKTVVNKHK